MSNPPEPQYPILAKMLDRLYVALMRGPGLNCKPHSSRQRIDLTDLEAFDDLPPNEVLQRLMGEQRDVRVNARVPQPEGFQLGGWHKSKKKSPPPPPPETPAPAPESSELPETGESAEDTSPELEAEPPAVKPEPPEDPAVRAFRRQRSLLTKLRNLSDDAKTYEQDTGVHALNIGYPVLSIPPGAAGGTRRILAPVAFIPVSLTVKAGGKPGIELACRGEGEDRIKPNPALMAWLERETGQSLPDDLFGDDEGDQPWKEVQQLIACVAKMLELPGLTLSGVPGVPGAEPSTASDVAGSESSDADAEQKTDGAEVPTERELAERFDLESTPRTDDLPEGIALLSSAVLGLFPASNQGLLRDTREMMKQPELTGPVESFVKAGVSLAESPRPIEVPSAEEQHPLADAAPRDVTAERFVARADPCQGRTVMLARTSTGLVMHGPPGTGKSQTITNIIGDHLARGQRVLFVCDKRTALDVVAHRLASLGLDGLCAVVHDAQRDQRSLYMGIRAQLDALSDTKTYAGAEKRVEKIDRELGKIHDELTALHTALMEAPAPVNSPDTPDTPDTPSSDPVGDGESFHELMGRWLSISAPALPEDSLTDVSLEQLERLGSEIEVVLERGVSVGYADNAWAQCAGSSLAVYLSRRSDAMRQALASCVEDARSADATRHDAIPPFEASEDLPAQATRRETLRGLLAWVKENPDAEAGARVGGLDAVEAERQLAQIKGAQASRAALESPLEDEIWLIVKDDLPSHRAIAEQLGALEQYLESAEKWWGFLAWGAKKQAAKVLRGYGLGRNTAAAERLRGFLKGLRERIGLTVIVGRLTGEESASGVMDDGALRRTLTQYENLLDARVQSAGDAALAEPTRQALTDEAGRSGLLDGLKRSPARAEALGRLESAMTKLDLFDAEWLTGVRAQCRAGSAIAPLMLRLQEGFDDLESVLRVKDGVATLPASCRPAMRALLDNSIDPAMGVGALTKRVLAHTLTRRVAEDPRLAKLDPAAIEHSFSRYGDLEDQKRELVKDVVLHRWRSHQKKRLLSATGTRKNALGAALQQRLFVRGSRAMRLRQVIALGRSTTYDDGGDDPLFDMAPVWLASPETVAQVFPREALFDVVVFDEASQCRLEEALPVLTRAKRVVIAGDPKQLPPTRFFEASVSRSDDAPIETEDDLFEAQQSEVEDLLAAALNLDVQESYLDVHYRSRNADLIEFSNQQFYNDRLQAIPGHPRNRTRYAPLNLHRVPEPVYDERINVPEAAEVVRIVDELLRRAEPPSIGIASFNLAQRDLIAEMLDERAMEDDDFSQRLAIARTRTGDDSFEGLFVKNLENVQGDERDHIVISTTYGPNPEGRFYRRFGPLAMPGGGRRLNVLVTRARQEVHLVTSIPAEAYRSYDIPPQGSTPSGSWLLFAYLRYAETLQSAYEENHRVLEQAAASEAQSFVRETRSPSRLAEAMGHRLARKQGVATDVFWGNDGFCVDLALHHPTRAEDVTVGVMCDFARFDLAPDAVEWDIYRCQILKWQGWALERLWSPTYFRDPTRAVNQIMQAADKEALQYPSESPTEGG